MLLARCGVRLAHDLTAIVDVERDALTTPERAEVRQRPALPEEGARVANPPAGKARDLASVVDQQGVGNPGRAEVDRGDDDRVARVDEPGVADLGVGGTERLNGNAVALSNPQSVSPAATTWVGGSGQAGRPSSLVADDGVALAIDVTLGLASGAGVAAGDALGNAGVAVELGVVIGTGGGDPVGVGLAGVAAHAARRTPRRRDAARRFAFICRRRWCCGLMAWNPRPGW